MIAIITINNYYNSTIEIVYICYCLFLFLNLFVEIIGLPFIAYNYGLSPFIISLFLLLVLIYPGVGFLLLIFLQDSVVISGWCLLVILSICGINFVALNSKNILLKTIGVKTMNGTLLQIMLQVYGLISYILIIITFTTDVIDWFWLISTVAIICVSRLYVWLDIRRTWIINGMYTGQLCTYMYI